MRRRLGSLNVDKVDSLHSHPSYRTIHHVHVYVCLEHRGNVGWASTCNSVGQTAGYFLGNIVFLALESKDFANRYIRQPFQLPLQSTGLVTLPGRNKCNIFTGVKYDSHSIYLRFFAGFLLFWGFTFALSTTLIALFKRETDDTIQSNDTHLGLIDTYRMLWKVLRLPAIRSIAWILLTIKVQCQTMIDNLSSIDYFVRF
jgi:MFS transporter, PAT family, solute carrier family 33 (acetyl-CoA transportor), member 1